MPETDGHAAGEIEPVVISVCVSCKRSPDDSDRPGERLLAALREAQLGPGIEVRPVQCLSVCKRPCTAAFSGPARYTYIFGDIEPEASAELVAGARVYREMEHGFMLWRERPEALRRGIVARVPPLGWTPDDGRHPR